METSIKRYEEQIEILKDFTDIDRENEEIGRKIKFETSNLINLAIDFKNDLEDKTFYKQMKRVQIEERELQLINQFILNEQAKIHVLKSEIASLIEGLKTLEKKRNEKKEELEDLKRDLKNKTITVEMQHTFRSLPDTIEKLEDEIAKESAILGFYDCDAGIEDDYKQKEAKLASIKKMIHKRENVLESLNSKINRLRGEVSNLINNLIKPINDKFAEFFKKFSCEGKLLFNEQGIPASKWSLNILVKFRESSKLEKLTSFKQSGGEKSVSTILFLLALQSISSSPFILVDEINQGMDHVTKN